jgi:hypothetical protein
MGWVVRKQRIEIYLRGVGSRSADNAFRGASIRQRCIVSKGGVGEA